MDGVDQVSRECIQKWPPDLPVSNYLGFKNTPPAFMGLSLVLDMPICTFVSPHEHNICTHDFLSSFSVNDSALG